ncbi:MAG: cell division protein FtsQ/DivIB [Lachnospiraceae bacterium]|nr:cell division protein FtsQ/DivIB [Lachnospiraceae bacterium]
MRSKRKRRFKNFFLLLAVVLILLAGLLILRVRKLTVSGNSRYSAETIKDDLITDFLSGNTLILWWTHKDGTVPDTMPYLESLKIEIKSPFSVTVKVTEKELVGYFDTGSYAYFDTDGIVLDITDELYDGIPVITGATVGEFTLYQKVPTESSSTLRTILSLLELLEYQDLTADEIRFSDNSEITVYIGYIEAELGQDEYLEEKVANLKAILDTFTSTTAGTLHLENVTGKNEDITFSPSDEVIIETETEETQEQESETDSSAAESSDTAGTDTGTTDTSTLSGITTDGSAVSGPTSSGQEDSTSSGQSDRTGGTTSDEGDSSDDTTSDEGEDSYSSSPDQGEGSDDTSSDSDGTANDSDDSDDGESDVDLMVFNSSGELVYHVHVRDGLVVDAYGNEVPGCSVNEDGYVVDAYWNIIDPATGELMN